MVGDRRRTRWACPDGAHRHGRRTRFGRDRGVPMVQRPTSPHRCRDGPRQPAPTTRWTRLADRGRCRPSGPDPTGGLLAPHHFSDRGRNSRLSGRQRPEAHRRPRPAARVPVGRAVPRLPDQPARERLPVESRGGRGRRRRRRLAVARPAVEGRRRGGGGDDRSEPHVRRRPPAARHRRRCRGRPRVWRDRGRRGTAGHCTLAVTVALALA